MDFDEIDQGKFDEISARVTRFIDAHAEYGGYDFKRGIEERRALAEGIRAYARGVRFAAEVEELTRRYVDACKIPGYIRQARRGNDEPPPLKEQKKQTYNYQQYHPTAEQKEMRRKMKARDELSARASEEMYQEGKRLHKLEFPACRYRDCPYHYEKKSLQRKR